ncbi:MAG: hypothetical protein HY331_15455 [Chloroflexi bacterium]|nr:hypothetical protein [Chloroflexota bacterium]
MQQRRTERTGQLVIRWLSSLAVGEGIAHQQDRMVIFPVWAGAGNEDVAGAALEYWTLAEAITEGWVDVTEKPTATVPELILRNRGRMMVLVLDGEEIVGGRQNRIVNASFLVAADSQVVLPVSCVEHGRWHDVSPRFRSGELGYHSLKRDKYEQVRANLRMSGRAVADQGAIWESIAARQAAGLVESSTGAMGDLYRTQDDLLAAYERAFPYVEGAIGLIAALHGRPWTVKWAHR